MALTREQFVERLQASRLPAAKTVVSAFQSLAPDQQPADAKAVAKWAVRRGWLTAFQAQQIYLGRHRQLVLGKYVVLEQLGRGGMGVVLKARHERMERVVALKMMAPSLTDSDDAVARFRREVKTAALLEHPNIVTAFDADEADGVHFLVMQFVDGLDLATYLRKRGTLSIAAAINYAIQAAEGLQYAHEKGVIHRDIKPSNLLLDRSGVVKVLDLGLARLDSQRDSLTSTGQIMGTADFMAPEQARAASNADARSDVYSLGATLWFWLTGRPVFQADSVYARLRAHQEDAAPSLCELRPETPERLDQVIQRMLAKDPADRWQTMSEVANALSACLPSSVEAPPQLNNSVEEDSKLHRFFAQIEQEASTKVGEDQELDPTVDMRHSSAGDETELVDDRSSVSVENQTSVSTRPNWLVWISAPLLLLAIVVAAIGSGAFSSDPSQPATPSVGESRWVDVLAQMDPIQHVPRKPFSGGKWQKIDGVLRSPAVEFARIRAPMEAASSYALQVEFARHTGDAVNVYLPVGDRYVLFAVDGFGGLGVSGLQSVNRENVPTPGETGVEDFRLESGKRYTLQLAVELRQQRAVIRAELEDEFEFQWEGPIEDLSLIDHRFELGGPHRLGLAAWNADVEFFAFRYRAAGT